MAWQQWVYLSFVILSALVSVSSVGRPRKPLQPGEAAIVLVIQGLLCLLVLSI